MIYPNNLELNRSIDKLMLGIIALNDLRRTTNQRYNNTILGSLRESLSLIFEDAVGIITARDITEIQGDSLCTLNQGTRYGSNPGLVIDPQDTGLLMLRFMGLSMNPDPPTFIIDPLKVIDLRVVSPLDN